MPAFTYRAINPLGRAIRGQLTARNDLELAHLIGEMGLELVTFRERQPSSLKKFLPERVSTRELIRIFDLLERMTRAGVPLREALGDARDSSEQTIMRDTLTSVHRDIGDGIGLSQALAKHPKVFSFICITLVGVGEQSGRMDDALSRLRAYLVWSDQMVNRTKKALRYPAFVGIMVIAVTAFMMLFVVPQVVSFLQSNNQELPFMTIALINTSDAFTNYWWLIFGTPCCLAMLIAAGRMRNAVFRRRTDRVLLELPVLGRVYRALSLARFMQVMAIMYRAGVPIVQSIQTAIPTVKNASLIESLSVVVTRIEGGVPLSRALQSTGEFNQSAIRLLQLGEATGELDDMLAQIAEDLNTSADDAIQSMIAKIEPGMTLILGGMMAWIALAVFGPIYDSLATSDF